ncbi:unnamed protein product [Tuber melanosporum]|uniref:(Perigord truffle) hypothetical protein n=1 Tax=Tuber melanosporum (strain Mel28) TaxID=656061 RepID=D5GAW9_TUBMM|nr:uncharacterized protein GSTUM_00005340001 [Tuber melanosporum]CAZ81662.1 unnamed protein product [Tuber melanosporum]
MPSPSFRSCSAFRLTSSLAFLELAPRFLRGVFFGFAVLLFPTDLGVLTSTLSIVWVWVWVSEGTVY